MTDSDIKLFKSLQTLYEYEDDVPWTILFHSTGIFRAHYINPTDREKCSEFANYQYNNENIQKPIGFSSDMQMVKYFWNDDMRTKLQKYLFQQL